MSEQYESGQGGPRRKVPTQVAEAVLFSNDFTCCKCHDGRVSPQIHHINGKSDDNRPENLSSLCPTCHSMAETRGGHGRSLSPSLVRRYKAEWEKEVASKRPTPYDERIPALSLELLQPSYCPTKSQKGDQCSFCSPYFDQVLDSLLGDQIPASGGWGQSQIRSYVHVAGQQPSELERAEGGIISTFLALRSLSSRHPNWSGLRNSEIGRSALRYLLSRQAPNGGFGRRVSSRSGVEIHASVRHTALAILALLVLEAAPDSILKGAEFVTRSGEEDALGDTSASIALAATVCAMQKLTDSEWASGVIMAEECERTWLKDWQDRAKRLVRYLTELSTSVDNEYGPLWRPYGGFPKQVFYTGLVTADLLIDADIPEVPAATLESVLGRMTDFEVDGGLPHDPQSDWPDVGMSGMFASVSARMAAKGQLSNSATGGRIWDAATRYFRFVVENHKTPKCTQATYCDTLAPVLLLRGCPWHMVGAG